jgi:hypothetical protein
MLGFFELFCLFSWKISTVVENNLVSKLPGKVLVTIMMVLSTSGVFLTISVFCVSEGKVKEWEEKTRQTLV